MATCRAHCNRLQQTATHCNILPETATHCQTHCQTLCNTLQHSATLYNILQQTTIHCNTLQYTATHYNTQQLTAPLCNTLQLTAPLCNILQHSATQVAKVELLLRSRIPKRNSLKLDALLSASTRLSFLHSPFSLFLKNHFTFFRTVAGFLISFFVALLSVSAEYIFPFLLFWGFFSFQNRTITGFTNPLNVIH